MANQIANSPTDPSIQTLMKSIGTVETNGDYTATGDGGNSLGAYQISKQNWSAWSQQYLGDANAPLTPANQDKVAYNRISDLASQGYKPSQIASIWNSGKADPTGNIGVNKQGEKFNTPQYVQSVGNTYNQIMGGNQNPATTPTDSTVGNQAPATPQGTTYGASNPASANDSLSTGIMKGIENIPSSAFNLGKNLWGAVTNPGKTFGNIVNAGAGGLEEGENALGVAPAGGFNNEQTNTFNNVVGALKQRYGSLDALRHTAENDPVGLALDVSTILSGVGEAVSATADVGDVASLTEGMSGADAAEFTKDLARNGALGTRAQIGGGISDVGEAVNPISMVGKGLGKLGDFAGNTGKYVLGQEGGVQSPTIGTTLEHPDLITPGAVAGANESRTALANDVLQGYNAKTAEWDDLGAKYGPIRAARTPVTVDPNFLLEQIQKNTGLDYNPDTDKFEFSTNASVNTDADIARVNKFYQNWQPAIDKGMIDSNEFLNMRQQMGEIAKFDGNGTGTYQLKNAAGGVYTNINAAYRNQIPGLENLDTERTAAFAERDLLKNKLFDKNDEPLSNFTNTVANATGKGKSTMLAQLEQISPGITEKIGIQKALEDWQSAQEGIKVGTYGKAGSILGSIATGGAVGGPMGAVMGGMISTLLTSPQVLVPALRLVGASQDIISSIMGKIASASPLSVSELTVFGNALSKVNAQKKPPISAFQP